jgi:hypothetical protein
MAKNLTPSPSGQPRIPLTLRIDPEIKAWLEAHEINPALLLEAAALAEKKQRTAGRGFAKKRKK